MTSCQEKPDDVYVLVQCPDCSAQVQVRARSGKRKRCRACQHKAQLQYQREHRARAKATPPEERKPRRPKAPPADPREYGPERPQLGMDENEYRAYKQAAAVRLYTHEGLDISLIAERLGVSRGVVEAALKAAGVEVVNRGHTWAPGAAA